MGRRWITASNERVCEALYASPSDPRGVDEWGAELGASARTLARRFERELGMSPGRWLKAQQQAE